MVIDSNYVETAEKVIKTLPNKLDRRNKLIPVVTTSKIRNILAMTSDIYNDVMNSSEDKLPEEITSRIEYLRIRIIYESGRDPSVKAFVEEAKLLDALKEIHGSKKNYIRFNHYMEALVAYHRYYGGEEN